MQSLMSFASIVLAAIVIWDVFITVFSSKGEGFLTQLWTQPLWQGLLFIHRRQPVHHVLALAGPFMLLLSIIIWYTLLGVSFYLAIAAYPNSVVNNTTGEPIDLLAKVYFVGTTLSSLGYGDLVPSGPPWTFLSTGATLAATIILTISLSYVLSVLSAAIERRKLAQGIFGLGTTIPEIMEGAQLDDSRASLKNYVLSLASEIEHQAFKYHAYPILKFFHAPEAKYSPVRAILLLSDTFFIFSLLPAENQPPKGVKRVVESSIGSYIESTQSDILTPSDSEQNLETLVEVARGFGILIKEDAAARELFDNYLQRRQRLVSLCREDGWDED